MASAAPPKPSVGIRDREGFWSPLRGCPAALLPCLYPALPCYGWYPPPPGSTTQPVPAASQELPGGVPLLWPVPPLRGPLLCAGSPEDPRWGKAAVWRESTGALRAWLGQHLQNPYPSKGEKVLLAVLSQRSLCQVSTWFANARRRLKKENRLRGGRRLPKALGEEEEEEKEGQAGDERAALGRSPQPKKAPWGRSGAAEPWQDPGQQPDPLPSIGRGAAERVPPDPKLWTEPAAPRHPPGKPRQWLWGLCPLRRTPCHREAPSCAAREWRREAPALGSHPWGRPGDLSGGVALPPPRWCALEVLDCGPRDAQLACQLVVQACGSAPLEGARLGKARISVEESLLHTGAGGRPGTCRAARQINPLGRWVELA